MNSKNSNFYQDLQSFSDFEQINNLEYFTEVPSDWLIIITDIKGSTKAIESGLYKDVNTVGAAAIACVQNATNDDDDDNFEFPFVFGGDGATMLIPLHKKEQVLKALAGLKTLSQDKFSLELRVGVVPMSVLIKMNSSILVAKYNLVGEQSVAIFRGGGLTQAEVLVKGSDDYELQSGAITSDEADLTGLSCRWQAIPSERGKILSLLVFAREGQDGQGDQEATYKNVLDELNHIFHGNIETANPVNTQNMTYNSLWACFKNERRMHSTILSKEFLSRFIEILISVLMFKFKMPGIGFDPKKFKKSMETHSDFRKFDDGLRMVLDCSVEQVSQVKFKLESLHKQEKVFFGLHESSNALMTCLVGEARDGKHIHFIDGGEGGYAMAAKQLKGQMK